MKPYLCVYGHAAIDHLLYLKHFPPPNTSVDVLDKERRYGGTGANMATIASSLGVPTALVSYVGEDFPANFEALMRGHGVMLDDLIRVKGSETPTVWVVTDEVQNQVAYVYQGPMARMGEYEPLTRMAIRSRVVHLSTGRPEYYLRVLDALESSGVSVSLDPSQEIHHLWSAESFRRALPRSQLLFANESEMKTAMKYLGVGDPSSMLEYVDAIINTRGARGSVLYDRHGVTEIAPLPPTKMVDPTGAGDAFRAGFYAGRYRGMNLRDSCIIATASASFALEAKGGLSSIPTWERVLERARLHPCWGGDGC